MKMHQFTFFKKYPPLLRDYFGNKNDPGGFKTNAT